MYRANNHYRGDIEGLRAIAALLVVLYHYFPKFLPGGYIGVDVFFLISGYLITLSIARTDCQHGRRRVVLVDFFARRVRRLLPNALLVLASTGAAGLVFLPDPALRRLGTDIFASATYSMNWLQIFRETDYLGWSSASIDPLIHYWSLSIEEQFYLIWPLALVFLYIPMQKRGRRMTPALGAAIWVALSFAYCLHLSALDATQAFFSLGSRCWELLLGATLALYQVDQGEATSHQPSRLLFGASFLAVMLSPLLFGRITTHPGIITWLPILGTMGLIHWGARSGGSYIYALLNCQGLRNLGQRSYALYLWHWPVLIVGRIASEEGGISRDFALLAVSVVLAFASFHWVEEPARRSWRSRLNSTQVVCIGLLMSLLVGLLGIALFATGSHGFRARLIGHVMNHSQRTVPELADLFADMPVIYENGCHLGIPDINLPTCKFGRPSDLGGAMIFGDSHAAQWFPALEAASHDRQITLYSLTKSSCPAADVDLFDSHAKNLGAKCSAWRAQAIKRMAQVKPSVVFISSMLDKSMVLIDSTGQLLRGSAAYAEFLAGLIRTVQQVRETGARVVLIRDVPHRSEKYLDCIYSRHEVGSCDEAIDPDFQHLVMDIQAAAATQSFLWDLTNDVCPAGQCPVLSVSGAAIVYRDSHHLTASFVKGLAPSIERLWMRDLPDVGRQLEASH